MAETQDATVDDGPWSLLALKELLEERLVDQDRRIREDAAALREHVLLQVGQIATAVTRAETDVHLAQQAAERLEIERITGVKERLATEVSNLADRVTAGDLRLHEHITAQVGQIASALEAARREADVALGANEKAIEKAEVATDKRFEAVNGLREQLAEQAGTFLPREVAEAQFAEMRRAISDLAEKVSKLA